MVCRHGGLIIQMHNEIRDSEAEMLRHWVNLFAHSNNAKLLWKERTAKSMCSRQHVSVALSKFPP